MWLARRRLNSIAIGQLVVQMGMQVDRSPLQRHGEAISGAGANTCMGLLF